MSLDEIKNTLLHKNINLQYMQPTTKLSSVLVILYCQNNPHIIMIKRNLNLNLHGGEIGFPGGKWINIDHTILDTAIRETKEELNLTINKQNIIYKLNPVTTTTTNITIIPFIAIINKIPPLFISHNEIETIFHMPLFSLLNTIESKNIKSYQAYTFLYRNNLVWGASARILYQIKNILL